MFSPYYAWTRGHGGGDPEHHCALNVALYGDTSRWTMTERGRHALRRTATSLAIGPSDVRWDGAALTFRIDELGAPLPRRVRGTVRVHPGGFTGHTVALDAAGRHRWSPMAPCARVEVTLDRPALRWSGPGYLDSNAGDRPLEQDFRSWTWSRAPLRDGTAILYDALRLDGSARNVTLKIDRAGTVTEFASPPVAALTGTFWRLARETRADAAPSIRETLTDAPFYARSVLATHILGEPASAMHESLSLTRFRAPWVQFMLPFRMPRALW